MGKHDIEISLQERDALVARARKLAPHFAEIGAQADQEGRFPVELVPLYKESGLAALAVPKRYGGLGGDLWTVALVEKELASHGDPAIALSFNMHHVMVGIFRELLNEEARTRLFKQVVEDNALISGPFSEERAGFSTLADTVAVPDGNGGWKVTGKKNWATFIEGADIVTFNATITDADGKIPTDHAEHLSRESVFIVSTKAPGVSIKNTWDTFSMRASGTQTCVFDNVHVPAEGYGGPFRSGLAKQMEWANFPFAGIYLGVADRALRLVREAISQKNLGHTAAGANTAVRNVGYMQYLLGEAAVELESAERTVRGTAIMLTEGLDTKWGPAERPARISIAQRAATEAAVKVSDIAMRLVGGSAIRRGQPLERTFRDARAGIYHPLPGITIFDLLGRAELGLLDAPAS
ncbi:acyl-CoA dehydrogenase family protein [Sinimarinibacterium sp. NLF-5-8]|uniref:acyl-CoA dehydrogenase family protein n=1 Tax=Sinimarinibacterium sp. NLF-5-8 TaxID=2698684 RepID=UPI00137BA5E2|nr:acyl-CoA dehydrogenase family protein [Sinimarinibacterium sp. NLF-5-8]QHS10295.1 acyl-CoA/acyl-ACP dehydrogenase [Sinimarinibacterium sp. NLF-5-8]